MLGLIVVGDGRIGKKSVKEEEIELARNCLFNKIIQIEQLGETVKKQKK